MKGKRKWKSVVSFLIVLSMMISPVGTMAGMGNVYAAENAEEYQRSDYGVEIRNGNLVLYVENPDDEQKNADSIIIGYKIHDTEKAPDGLENIRTQKNADNKFELVLYGEDISDTSKYLTYNFGKGSTTVKLSKIKQVTEAYNASDVEGCEIRGENLYINIPKGTARVFYYGLFDTQQAAKTTILDAATPVEVDGMYEYSAGKVTDLKGKWLTFATNASAMEVAKRVVPVTDETIALMTSLDTRYKVEYYFESTAVDNNYELDSTKTKTVYAKEGTSVTVTGETIEGFTLNNEKSKLNGTVTKSNSEAGELVLKLYYERNNYTITYELNGGKFEADANTTQKYIYGASSAELRTPTKENNKFLGWYDGKNYVSNEDLPNRTADIKLTAQWVEKGDGTTTQNYVINHYLQKADESEEYELTESVEALGRIGETVSATNAGVLKIYIGFKNVTPADKSSIKIDANAEKNILNIYYDRESYSITYHLNGTDTEEIKNTNDETYVYGIGMDLADPTRRGYTFLGWYTNPECTAESKVTSIATEQTGAVTLYAKWEEGEERLGSGIFYRYGEFIFYTDLFDKNTAVKKMCGFYTSQQDAENDAAERNANHSIVNLPGFDLKYDEDIACWYLVEGYALDSDITHIIYTDFDIPGNDFDSFSVVDLNSIKAQEKIDYTVEHYKVNENGDYDLAETETKTGLIGKKVTAVDNAKDYAGYEVSTTAENTAKAGLLTGKKDVVIKVYYDKLSYDIEYDLNYKDAPEYNVPEENSYVYGVGLSELPTPPARDGYWFTGWNTDKDGKGQVKTNISATDEGNVTLYAQWTAKEEGKAAYTVKHYQQNKTCNGYILNEIEFVANVDAGPVEATAKEYTGFKVNSKADGTKPSGSATTEGTLVLAVYYDREKYTIQYFDGTTELTGEALPEGNPTSYIFGNDVELGKLASKEDSVFGGWYTSAEFTGTAVDEISDIATGNMKLYARWVTPITKLTLSDKEKILEIDDTFELTAEIEPEDAIEKTIKWRSSDDTVATVKDGVVTALKKGTATITATAVGDVEATCNITVVQKASVVERTGTGIERTPDGNILFYVADVPEGYQTDKGIYPRARGFENKEEAYQVADSGEPTDFWGSPEKMKYDEDSECWVLAIDPKQIIINENPLFDSPYVVYGFYYTGAEGNKLGELRVVSQDDMVMNGTYEIVRYLQNTDKTEYDAQPARTATGRYDTVVRAETTAPRGFVYNPAVAGNKAEATLKKGEQLTLNVYFDRVDYKVAYELDGGNWKADDTIPEDSYTYGVGIKELQKPEKAGYTFAGWYDNKDFKGEAIKTIGTDVAKDITLYAKWVISVTGIALKEGIAATTEQAPYILEKGKELTLEVIVTPGNATDQTMKYESSDENVVTVSDEGKVTAVGDGTATITITPLDATSTATPIKYYISVPATYYTVTFNPDNGTEKTTKKVKKDDTVEKPETDPTKPGYRFMGWYPEDGTSAYDFTTKVTADITLTAKWAETAFTVTFDTDGGSEVEPQTVAENEKAEKPADPTKSGYKFAGWYLDDESYDFETAVTTNLILTAKWIKIISYVVEFDTDGGSEVEAQTVEEGNTAEKPEDPTKEGYVFAGWYIDGESYDFEAEVTGDLKLIARWEVARTQRYVVTFDSNGGSVVGTQVVEAGKLVQQPPEPTKAGNIFLGWYNENIPYDFTTPVTTHLSLVAWWAEDTTLAPTIPEVKVTGIKITGISKKIAAGKKIQLTAAVAPANATNTAVEWISSNTKYATVDATGLVKINKNAKKKTVTITALAKDGSGVTAVYKIQVMEKAVTKLTVKAAKTVKAGKTTKITATVSPSKKVNSTLEYTSSNTKYATVTSKGVVKTKKAGKGKTVKITIKTTDGSNKKKTIKIKIE